MSRYSRRRLTDAETEILAEIVVAIIDAATESPECEITETRFGEVVRWRRNDMFLKVVNESELNLGRLISNNWIAYFYLSDRFENWQGRVVERDKTFTDDLMKLKLIWG